jgi:hypothetical protein
MRAEGVIRISTKGRSVTKLLLFSSNFTSILGLCGCVKSLESVSSNGSFCLKEARVWPLQKTRNVLLVKCNESFITFYG